MNNISNMSNAILRFGSNENGPVIESRDRYSLAISYNIQADKLYLTCYDNSTGTYIKFIEF